MGAARKNIFGWSAKEKAREAERVRRYKEAGDTARAATSYYLQQRAAGSSSRKTGTSSRKRADDLNREFLERQTTRRTAAPKSATFKGRQIQEQSDGSWVVPSIDRESHFDSLADAKAFVSSWKRNPKVTDRAHRYRAQRLAPAGQKVCALCGSKKNVVPDHKDGHPDHTTPGNLQWLCKSCNTAKGFWMRNHGKGRLTHQYNPAEGVPTYKQYAFAVATHTPGAHDEGGPIIHATPKKLRSEYARQIADAKRSRARLADDERWNPAQLGSVPVFPLGTESFASVPSQADFPSMEEAVAYAEAVREEHTGVGVLGRIDGATNKPVYAVIFDFSKLRAANPAKFDRCVKEVKARGGDVNAYAVCTAAGTRNPESVKRPYKTAGNWEFWLLNGEIYRNEKGNRGYPVNGIPANARWESSKAHFDKFFPAVYKNSRSNPESAAAALYESFHGVPSTTILEIEELEADHGNLTLLGRLVDCYAVTLTGFLAHFEFDDEPPVWCSSSEDGRQLYFVGGEQDIDLAALKMDGSEWIKDRMVIGQFAPPICGKCGMEFTKKGQTFTCPHCGHKATYEDHDDKDVVYNIGYHTRKKFDDMDPIDYQHDLGEETGVRPMLEYDPRTKHLYVTGGQYRIDQPLFEMSPGIEN
jgi:predicted RNA-binding Zn-ribbon protein involved in translation (DUF1610 family)